MPPDHKHQVVHDLTGLLWLSDTVIVADPTGLPVSTITEIRRQLEPTARLVITKNTLARRAVSSTGARHLLALLPLLAGPSALVFVAGDADHAARAIRPMPVRGACIDRRPSTATAEDVARLADTPPRAVLLATIAGLLTAGPARMAATLAAYHHRKDTP